VDVNIVPHVPHPVYAVEILPSGYGINATQLAIEAGIPIEWPPNKYVSFLGLVLL